ncbi:hypothetical protein [Akkermansia muciniphila]|uniref:hypothetical protein n=1 Tax=Akkermansia muciniphila TaxID=239935 RepID=UPI0021C5EDB9|nr:hypothetical protein [Akkermansia muciniphila]
MTLTQEETERYARHLSLPELGEQGQYKLKRAHVALTGLGGLAPRRPFILLPQAWGA